MNSQYKYDKNKRANDWDITLVRDNNKNNNGKPI